MKKSITYFNKYLVPKKIPVGNYTEYKEHYVNTLNKINLSEQLLVMYDENYRKCERDILDTWETDWQYRCDGKSVFQAILWTFSSKFGIHKTRLESEIKNMVDLSKDYEASKIVNEILVMFQN